MKAIDSNWYRVMHAPILSHEHLTEADYIALVETLPGEDFHDTVCMIGGAGAMLYCGDTDHLPESAPISLRKVLEWGRNQGFDWVRIDTAGDVIDGLPVYER